LFAPCRYEAVREAVAAVAAAEEVVGVVHSVRATVLFCVRAK
jgi:hypothetical protein